MHHGIQDVAVKGRGRPTTKSERIGLVFVVNPEEGGQAEKRVRSTCGQRLEIYRSRDSEEIRKDKL